MRKPLSAVVSVLILVGVSFAGSVPSGSSAQPAAPAVANGDHTAAVLPVKRVVLYKNGVGYFEHAGRVRGSQDLSIEFTTAQLNDVLKSLTAVDLGGGQITGVRYNSIAPLAERLKTLQISLGEDVTSAAFLNALRGTRVEVRSGGMAAVGKVLSVEKVQKETAKGGTVEVTQLSVIADSGELRTFEMGPGTSVRMVDGEIRQDVGRYLSLVGSTRSKDVRRMTISAAGAGERELFVSYISEVPVWKSTYRIVIPKAPGTPFLQGWAIVDNTVGEDWKDVQLSLVSGAPQSFIQNISQPYYTRRPVVALPQSVMLTPQEHEASLEEKDKVEEARGVVGGVPGGVPGGEIGGVVGGIIGPPPPPAAAAPVRRPSFGKAEGGPAYNGRIAVDATMNTAVQAAMRGQESGAEAAKLGELFQYALKQKITVLKNQSALVPIVQSPIQAERVTLVTAEAYGNSTSTPLRALWLKNTSGLMLDGGTFNILEEDSFAGEGVMDVLHPTERRLLSYAADTAVRVKAVEGIDSGTKTHVIIAKGLMRVTREQRGTRTYTVRNADTIARDVVIEHPIRPNFQLVEGLKPEESSVTHHRFKLRVEPGKTATLEVKEFRPEYSNLLLTNLTDEQVDMFRQQRSLTPKMEEAFLRVLGKKNQMSAVNQELQLRDQEMQSIDRDQARLRENMKALKGSAEEKALLQRYTRQLDSQEDRIAALRTEIAGLQDKRGKMQTELDTIVQEIALDETL